MPEHVIARYKPDRAVYIRAHLIMAAAATIGIAVVLAILGNGHIWVAFVAAPIAIAVRGIYLAPEELSVIWELTDKSLTGPSGQPVRLSDIATVRTLGSAAQVVTHKGDKHLLKYLADPRGIASDIERAIPA